MNDQRSVENEKSLICGVIDRRLDIDLHTYVSSLDPDAFLHYPYRKVWKAFGLILAGGGLIDSWTLESTMIKLGATRNDCDEMDRVFTDLQFSNGTSDLAARVNAVADAYKRRVIARAASRLAERVSEADIKTLEADLAEVVSAVSRAGNPTLKASTDYARQFEAFLSGEAILPAESRMNLSKTGIEGIDRSAVMNPGRLIVVGGLPSAGKTAFAVQVACRTALEGRRVALGSLEMDEDEIAARMVAHACRVDSLHALRQGGHRPASEDRGILDGIRANIVGLHGCAGDSWTAIEGSIIREHRKSPLSVVIVDYLQLMEAPELKRRMDNEAQRIGEITKSAKRLAQKLRCNVWLLSQFNREAEEAKEPSLQNFLGSGQIERDIDIGLLLWAEKPMYEPGEMRNIFCRIAKNRGGERYRKVIMSFDPARNVFKEIERSTEPIVVKNGKSRLLDQL